MRKQKHWLRPTWNGIKTRCYNQNNYAYRNYGARGIKVEFNNFEEFVIFIEGTLGPKPTPTHTLDRIDNDSNYTPNNLRWAQVNNRRLKHNPENYLGKTFGTRTITKWLELDHNGRRIVETTCSCGNKTRTRLAGVISSDTCKLCREKDFTNGRFI